MVLVEPADYPPSKAQTPGLVLRDPAVLCDGSVVALEGLHERDGDSEDQETLLTDLWHFSLFSLIKQVTNVRFQKTLDWIQIWIL